MKKLLAALGIIVVLITVWQVSASIEVSKREKQRSEYPVPARIFGDYFASITFAPVFSQNNPYDDEYPNEVKACIYKSDEDNVIMYTMAKFTQFFYSSADSRYIFIILTQSYGDVCPIILNGITIDDYNITYDKSGEHLNGITYIFYDTKSEKYKILKTFDEIEKIRKGYNSTQWYVIDDGETESAPPVELDKEYLDSLV